MSAAGELSSPSVQGGHGAGPGPSSRAAKQHSSRSHRGTGVQLGRHATAHAVHLNGAALRSSTGAGPSRANPPASTNDAAGTTAAPSARRSLPGSMRGGSGAAPAAAPAAAAAPRAHTTAAPAARRRPLEVVDLVAESSDDEVVLVGVKAGIRPATRPVAAKRPRTLAKPVQLAPVPAPAPPPVPEAPPSPEGYRCPICLESVDRMATTPCGHVFCEPCLTMAIKARKQCPKCRKNVQLRQIHRIFLTD